MVSFRFIYLNARLIGKVHYQVGLQLAAKFTIQDVVFRVSGDLPDLQSGSELDFTFRLQLEDPQETLDARDFLSALDSTLSFDTATASVSQDVKSQLVDYSSQLLDVTIVLHRTAAGTFFLKTLTLDLQAGFDWSPIEDVPVRNLAVSVNMTRAGATLPWQYYVDVSGVILVRDVQIQAKAQFNVADSSGVKLIMELSSLVGVGPADFLDIFAPGTADSAKAAVVTQLPPDLSYLGAYIDRGHSGLRVTVLLESRPSSTWSVSSIEILMSFHGVIWQSPAPNNNTSQRITLEDIYMVARISHQDTTTPTLSHAVVATSVNTSTADHVKVSVTKSLVATTTTTWKYSGILGGIVNLRNGQFSLAVTASYDSVQDITLLQATLPDGTFGSISDLGGDLSFSPAGIVPVDLGNASSVAQVPTESPVQLTLAEDVTGGTNRMLRLSFSGTELVRLLLRAQYSSIGGWQLTDAITLIDMGIMFDLINPQNLDPTKVSTTGLVYGSVTISESFKIFALIAGVKDNTSTDIWASFSVTLIPRSTLGVAPTNVISDPKLLGRAPPVADWGLPSSFPAANTAVSDALASTDAFLDVKFHKESSNFSLLLLRLRAFTNSPWEIFSGLTLLSAELDIYLQKPQNNAELPGYVTVSGSSQIGDASSPYIVDTEATFQRNAAAQNSFRVTLNFSQLSGFGNVLPATITGLSAFGSNAFDISAVTRQIPGEMCTLYRLWLC